MRLDGLTLLIAGWFVAVLAAMVLLGAWTQMRNATALLWWAAGHAVNSLGAAAFAVGLATMDPVAATIGGGAIALSMAGYWTGTRAFYHRRPPVVVVGGAMAVWAVTAVPALAGSNDAARASVAFALLLTASLLFLACRDLWQGRNERLGALVPLMAVFALHGSFMAVGFIGIATGTIVVDALPSLMDWFGIVHFERLIFLVGTTVFMVIIARERRELHSAAASRVDSLTGAATRAAFYVQAERIVRRAASDGSTVCAIVFDLDHFKAINDTYGHAVGDRVLRAFAETAMAVLRPGDIFGRVGGEEFVALLPGAGVEAGHVIADRVRRAFEVVPKTPGGSTVQATVSGGVAAAAAPASLESILETADRALYRAKAAGRNRITRASGPRGGDQTGNVIRVA